MVAIESFSCIEVGTVKHAKSCNDKRTFSYCVCVVCYVGHISLQGMLAIV